MPIDPELLEILACPECKTPVEVVRDGAGLRCAKCRRVYPVQDDIPVMLVDEARTVDDAEHERLMAKAEAEGTPSTLGE